MKDIMRDLIYTGQALHTIGCAPAGMGNISNRFEEDKVIIAAADCHKGRLEEDDLLVVNLSGAPLPDDDGDIQKPPPEASLHTQIYRAFPWVNSVINTHSINATVLSQVLYSENTIYFNGYEMQKVFRGIQSARTTVAIPIIENADSIARLADNAAAALGSPKEPPAYLIRGLGVYIWGESLAATLNYVEALEFLLQCEYEAKDLRTK